MTIEEIKKEQKRILIEASSRTKNDTEFWERHLERRRKMEALEKEDKEDFLKVKNKYIDLLAKEVGLVYIDAEPDPFKRLFYRCKALGGMTVKRD